MKRTRSTKARKVSDRYGKRIFQRVMRSFADHERRCGEPLYFETELENGVDLVWALADDWYQVHIMTEKIVRAVGYGQLDGGVVMHRVCDCDHGAALQEVLDHLGETMDERIREVRAEERQAAS